MAMTRGAWRAGLTLAAAIVLAMDLSAGRASAQTVDKPSIDLPNPYAAGAKFGQLPEGRQWGGVIGPGTDFTVPIAVLTRGRRSAL
jgi:hypothetical protein